MCWENQIRADWVFSLLWWQRDTYWAASTQQVLCSPNRYGSFYWFERVLNVGWICCILSWNTVCISVYLEHSVRKCSSVSIWFRSQCEHNLCSGGSHVFLCLPVSIISLCLLSLYLVNVLLSFLSDTVHRYSAILFSLTLSLSLSLFLSPACCMKCQHGRLLKQGYCCLSLCPTVWFSPIFFPSISCRHFFRTVKEKKNHIFLMSFV